MKTKILRHITLLYYREYRYIKNNCIDISLAILFFLFSCLYYNHVYYLRRILEELCNYARKGRHFDICELLSYTTHMKILVNVIIIIYILLNIKKGCIWYIWTITWIIIFAVLLLFPAIENLWTSYMYNYPIK